ncbi:MFS transporter [Protaetiibacter intestinalis]|uniref:MFS transporter n=1 Tax=Protaetiibacter intestinalis TaxID=2419774 RepID=UPI00130083F5|nr:MFS transporter [Protaetiibacter intestinalis]
MTEATEPVTRLAQLRRMTGTWLFVVAFAARIPVAMNVVGVLTLVTLVRGSVAEGGLVSAALGIASGVGGPLLGAIADRHGQRGVLLVVAVLHPLVLAGLVGAVYAELPIGVVTAAGAVAGATIPPVSPLMRARWLALLAADTRAGGRGVPTALGYESMADEISFVGGPVLVGVLATTLGPVAPLAASAAIVVVFVAAFAVHPTATLVHAGDHEVADAVAPRRALLTASVLLPTAGMLAMGAFFGATLASLTAFMEEAGAGESMGLLYGIMGATSAVAAVLVGRLPARFPLGARWATGFAALALAGLALTLAPSIPVIAAVFALAGVAVGATLVTLFTIGAEAAPAGRLATTMTMLSSGIILGQGVTVALVGAVAESAGADASFAAIAIAAVAGLATALAFLARRARLN